MKVSKFLERFRVGDYEYQLNFENMEKLNNNFISKDTQEGKEQTEFVDEFKKRKEILDKLIKINDISIVHKKIIKLHEFVQELKGKEDD